MTGRKAVAFLGAVLLGSVLVSHVPGHRAEAATSPEPTAYVTNLGSNDVTPIAVATNTPGAPIPVGDGPYGVAITPDGATAYIADHLDDTVTPIAVASNTAGTPVPVGNGPFVIAITPG